MNPARKNQLFPELCSGHVRSLVDCGVLSGTAGWFGMVKSGVGIVMEYAVSEVVSPMINMELQLFLRMPKTKVPTSQGIYL